MQVHAVHAPAHAPHPAGRVRRVRVDHVSRALRLPHDARRPDAVQRAAAESAPLQVVQERALAAHRQRPRHRQDVMTSHRLTAVRRMFSLVGIAVVLS